MHTLRRCHATQCGVKYCAPGAGGLPANYLLNLVLNLTLNVLDPHKNGVGTLCPDLSLIDPPCFIGSCQAQRIDLWGPPDISKFARLDDECTPLGLALCFEPLFIH